MDKEKVKKIVIIVLVAVVILGIVYLVLSNIGVIGKSTKMSDEELYDYLSYVPVIRDRGAEKYYKDSKDAYSSKNITVDNVDDRLLLLTAYNKLVPAEADIKVEDEACGKKACMASDYYKIDELENKIKDMYNKSTLKYTDAHVPGGHISKKEEYYALFVNNSQEGIIRFSKIVSSKYKGDLLIINEKAGFALTNIAGRQFILSKTTSKDGEIAKVGVEEDTQKYFEEHLNELNTYKHTFKKNGNGYYWYSTEKV